MAQERLGGAAAKCAAAPSRWGWSWQAALAPLVAAAEPLLARAAGACHWLMFTTRQPPAFPWTLPHAPPGASGPSLLATPQPKRHKHQQHPMHQHKHEQHQHQHRQQQERQQHQQHRQHRQRSRSPGSNRDREHPSPADLPNMWKGPAAPAIAALAVAAPVVAAPAVAAVGSQGTPPGDADGQLRAAGAGAMLQGAAALMCGGGSAALAAAASSWPWSVRQGSTRTAAAAAGTPAAAPAWPLPVPPPSAAPSSDVRNTTCLQYECRRFCARVAADGAADGTVRAEAGMEGGWARRRRGHTNTAAAEGAAGGVAGGSGGSGVGAGVGHGRLQRRLGFEGAESPVRRDTFPRAMAGWHDRRSDEGGNLPDGGRLRRARPRSDGAGGSADGASSSSPYGYLPPAYGRVPGAAVPCGTQHRVPQPGKGVRPPRTATATATATGTGMEVSLEGAAETALTLRGLGSIRAVHRVVQACPEVRPRLPPLDAVLSPIVLHQASADAASAPSGVLAAVQSAAKAIAAPCAQRVRNLPHSRRCDIVRRLVEDVYGAVSWAPYDAIVATAERLTRHPDFADPAPALPLPPPRAQAPPAAEVAAAAMQPLPPVKRQYQHSQHQQHQTCMRPAGLGPADGRAAEEPTLPQGAGPTRRATSCGPEGPLGRDAEPLGRAALDDPWVMAHAALGPVMSRWLSDLDPRAVFKMLSKGPLAPAPAALAPASGSPPSPPAAIAAAATAAAVPSITNNTISTISTSTTSNIAEVAADGVTDETCWEARSARSLCALLRGLHHLQLQLAAAPGDERAAAAGAAAATAGEPRLHAAAFTTAGAESKLYTAAPAATVVAAAAESVVLGAAWAEQRNPGVVLGRYGPSLELGASLLVSLERLGFRVRCRAHADFISACLQNWRTAVAPEVAPQGPNTAAAAGARTDVTAAAQAPDSAVAVCAGPREEDDMFWGVETRTRATREPSAIAAGDPMAAEPRGAAPCSGPGTGVLAEAGVAASSRGSSGPGPGPGVASPALARVALRALQSLGYHEHQALERLATIGSRCGDGRRLVPLRLRQRRPTQPLWNPPVFLADQLALAARYGSRCWWQEPGEPIGLRSPALPPLAPQSAPPQLLPRAATRLSLPERQPEPAQQHVGEQQQQQQQQQQRTGDCMRPTAPPKAGGPYTSEREPWPGLAQGEAGCPCPEEDSGAAQLRDREQHKRHFRALASARLFARLRAVAAALSSAGVLGKDASPPPPPPRQAVAKGSESAAATTPAPALCTPGVDAGAGLCSREAAGSGSGSRALASLTAPTAAPLSRGPFVSSGLKQCSASHALPPEQLAASPAPARRQRGLDGAAIGGPGQPRAALVLGCLAEGAALLDEAVAEAPRRALRGVLARELGRGSLGMAGRVSALELADRQLRQLGLLPAQEQPPLEPPASPPSALPGLPPSWLRPSAPAPPPLAPSPCLPGSTASTAPTGAVEASVKGSPRAGAAQEELGPPGDGWGEAVHPPPAPDVSPLLQAARILRHTRATLDALSTVKLFQRCVRQYDRELYGPLREGLEARVLQLAPGLATTTPASASALGPCPTSDLPLPTSCPCPADVTTPSSAGAGVATVSASTAGAVPATSGAVTARVSFDPWDPWVCWTPEQQDLAAAASQLLLDDVGRGKRCEAATSSPLGQTSSAAAAGPADASPPTAAAAASTMTRLKSAAVQLLPVMRPEDAVNTLGALRHLGLQVESLPAATLRAVGRVLVHRAPELSYSGVLNGLSLAAWLVKDAASGRQGLRSPWRAGGSGGDYGPYAAESGCEGGSGGNSCGGSAGEGALTGTAPELNVAEALGDELVVRMWHEQQARSTGSRSQDGDMYGSASYEAAPRAAAAAVSARADREVEETEKCKLAASDVGSGGHSPSAALRVQVAKHPSNPTTHGRVKAATQPRPLVDASASGPLLLPQPLEALRLLNAAGIRHPRLALAAAVGLLPDPTSRSRGRRWRLLLYQRFDPGPLGTVEAAAAAGSHPPWSAATLSSYDSFPLPAPPLIERMVSEGFLRGLELVALLQVTSHTVHSPSPYRRPAAGFGAQGGATAADVGPDPSGGGSGEASAADAVASAATTSGHGGALAAERSVAVIWILRRKVLDAMEEGERLPLTCLTCLLEEAGRDLPSRPYGITAAAAATQTAVYRRHLLHALHEAAAREYGGADGHRGPYKALYNSFYAIQRELLRATQPGPLPTASAAETALAAALTMSRMLPYAAADATAGGLAAEAAIGLASRIVKTQRSCSAALAAAAERLCTEGLPQPNSGEDPTASSPAVPRLLLLQLQLQLSQLSRDAVRHLLQPLSDAAFLQALEHNEVLLEGEEAVEVRDTGSVVPVRQTMKRPAECWPWLESTRADAGAATAIDAIADVNLALSAGAHVGAAADAFVDAAIGEGGVGSIAGGQRSLSCTACGSPPGGVTAAGNGAPGGRGSISSPPATTRHLSPSVQTPLSLPWSASTASGASLSGSPRVVGRPGKRPGTSLVCHTGASALHWGAGQGRDGPGAPPMQLQRLEPEQQQMEQEQRSDSSPGRVTATSRDAARPLHQLPAAAPVAAVLHVSSSSPPSTTCSSSSDVASAVQPRSRKAAEPLTCPGDGVATNAAVCSSGSGSCTFPDDDGLRALDSALRAAAAAAAGATSTDAPSTTASVKPPTAPPALEDGVTGSGADRQIGGLVQEGVDRAATSKLGSSKAPYGATGAKSDRDVIAVAAAAAGMAGGQQGEVLWRTPAMPSSLPLKLLSPRRPLPPGQREVNRRLVTILRESGSNVEKVMAILRLTHKHSQAIALPTQAALQLALGNCLPTVNSQQLHELLQLINSTNMYPPSLVHRAARRALALYGNASTATAVAGADGDNGPDAAGSANASEPAARVGADRCADGGAAPAATDWLAARLLTQLVRVFASMSPAAEVDGALFRAVVQVTAGAVRHQLAAAALAPGVVILQTDSGGRTGGRIGGRTIVKESQASSASPSSLAPGPKEAVQLAEGFLGDVQVVCNRLRPAHRNAVLAAVVPVRALVARSADEEIQTLFLGVLASSGHGQPSGPSPSGPSPLGPPFLPVPSLAQLQLLVAHLPQLGSVPGLSALVNRLLEAHEPYLAGSLREPGFPPWRVADQLLRASAQCVPTVRLELLEGLQDRVLMLPSPDLMTLSARCGFLHLLPPLTLAACVNRLRVHFGTDAERAPGLEAGKAAAAEALAVDGSDVEPDAESFVEGLYHPPLRHDTAPAACAATSCSGRGGGSGVYDNIDFRGPAGEAPPPASVALAGLVDAISRRMLAPPAYPAAAADPTHRGAADTPAVEVAAATAAAASPSVGPLPYERRIVADPPLLSLGVAHALAAVLTAGGGQRQGHGERPLELTRVARDMAGRVACALASQALTSPPVRRATTGSGRDGISGGGGGGGGGSGGVAMGGAAGEGLELGLAASVAAALHLHPPADGTGTGGGSSLRDAASPRAGSSRRGRADATAPAVAARLARPPPPPLLLLQGPEALLRLLQTAAEQYLRYDNDQSELMQRLLTTALSLRSRDGWSGSRGEESSAEPGLRGEGGVGVGDGAGGGGGGGGMVGGARLAWLLQVMRSLLELPAGGGWGEYAAAAAYLRKHRAAAEGSGGSGAVRDGVSGEGEQGSPSQQLWLQLLVADVQEELAALGGETLSPAGSSGAARGVRGLSRAVGVGRGHAVILDQPSTAGEALYGTPMAPAAAAATSGAFAGGGKRAASRSPADRDGAAVGDAVAAAAMLGVPSGALGAAEATGSLQPSGTAVAVHELRALGTPFGLAVDHSFWDATPFLGPGSGGGGGDAGAAAAAAVATMSPAVATMSSAVRRSLLTAVRDRIATLVEKPNPQVMGLLAPPPHRRLPLAEAEAETVTMMAAGVRRRPLLTKSPGLLELELVQLAMGGGPRRKGRPPPKSAKSSAQAQGGGSGRLYDTVRQLLDELEVELSCEADSGVLCFRGDGGSSRGGGWDQDGARASSSSAAARDGIAAWRRQLLVEAVEVLGLLFAAKGELLESVVGVIASDRWWPSYLPRNAQLSANALARQLELMYGSLLELVQGPLLAAVQAEQLGPEDVVRVLEGLALPGQHRVTKDLAGRLFDGLSDWLLRKANEADVAAADYRRSQLSAKADATVTTFAVLPPDYAVASGDLTNGVDYGAGMGVGDVRTAPAADDGDWKAAGEPGHQPGHQGAAGTKATKVPAPSASSAVIALYDRAAAAMATLRCDAHPALPALARAFAQPLEGMQVHKLVEEMKRLAGERRAARTASGWSSRGEGGTQDAAQAEAEAETAAGSAAAAAAAVTSELLRRMASLSTSEQIRAFQVLAADGAADGAFVEAVADMVMFHSQNLSNAHFAGALWALALVASSAATVAAVRGPNATELMRAAAASLKARPAKPAVVAMALAAATRLTASGCSVDRALVAALQRALATRIAEKRMGAGRELGTVLHWLTQGSLQRQHHRRALLARPGPAARGRSSCSFSAEGLEPRPEQGGGGQVTAAAEGDGADGGGGGAIADSGLVPVLDAIAEVVLRSMGLTERPGAVSAGAIVRGPWPGDDSFDSVAVPPARADVITWLELLEGLYRLGYSQSGGWRWQAMLTATHGAVRAVLRAEALQVQEAAFNAAAASIVEAHAWVRTADWTAKAHSHKHGNGGQDAAAGTVGGSAGDDGAGRSGSGGDDGCGGGVGGGEGSLRSAGDVDVELLLRAMDALLTVDALTYDLVQIGSELLVAMLEAGGEGAGLDGTGSLETDWG